MMKCAFSGHEVFAWLSLVVVAAGLFAVSEVLAIDPKTGADEFRASCASCHGLTGKGDGEMADVLKVKPADLTVLAKNNGGEYPFLRVYGMIDGRGTEVKGHGTREMPIWGRRYLEEDKERYGPFGGEEVVQARILQIVYYIQTLQEE